MRLIVGPSDHGWEVRGDGDLIDEFATEEAAELAARALARELGEKGRKASVWRRDPAGGLSEAPSLPDES